MEVPVASTCSTAVFWADLLKMVGFPVLTAAYFAWKDLQFTKDITTRLSELSERVHPQGGKGG